MPGMLQVMVLQKVGDDLATQQQHTISSIMQNLAFNKCNTQIDSLST